MMPRCELIAALRDSPPSPVIGSSADGHHYSQAVRVGNRVEISGQVAGATIINFLILSKNKLFGRSRM